MEKSSSLGHDWEGAKSPGVFCKWTCSKCGISVLRIGGPPPNHISWVAGDEKPKTCEEVVAWEIIKS